MCQWTDIIPVAEADNPAAAHPVSRLPAFLQAQSRQHASHTVAVCCVCVCMWQVSKDLCSRVTVAIRSFRRPGCVYKCIREIRKHWPSCLQIVVADDSEDPLKVPTLPLGKFES